MPISLYFLFTSLEKFAYVPMQCLGVLFARLHINTVLYIYSLSGCLIVPDNGCLLVLLTFLKCLRVLLLICLVVIECDAWKHDRMPGSITKDIADDQ